jgi:hypothetical protein
MSAGTRGPGVPGPFNSVTGYETPLVLGVS